MKTKKPSATANSGQISFHFIVTTTSFQKRLITRGGNSKPFIVATAAPSPEPRGHPTSSPDTQHADTGLPGNTIAEETRALGYLSVIQVIIKSTCSEMMTLPMLGPWFVNAFLR